MTTSFKLCREEFSQYHVRFFCADKASRHHKNIGVIMLTGQVCNLCIPAKSSTYSLMLVQSHVDSVSTAADCNTFSLLNFITSVPNTPGEIVHIPYFALAIFVFVWVNDTGAYLVGSMLGKRRLFERISPKKSWEGFYGGLAFVLITSQIFAWFMPATNWYTWLGLAGTIVVFGTWGDLIESLMKRTLGVKDSGHVLPGHGGMLDRFDSVMMAIPAAYIYIELFIRN